MKEILGSPPVFVFLGHHADIDSSSTIHIDGWIRSRHCWLNSSMADENSHHGSVSLTWSFSQILAITFRYSLNLFSLMYTLKSGLFTMVCQVLGSAVAAASWLSFFHNSQPLQLNPAAAIVTPNATKNSFSVNGRIFDPLALLLRSETVSFSFLNLDFQS